MSARASRWRYGVIRRACALIGVPYFRPRVAGREHVLRKGAFILACNHATLLDWAALAYFVPRPIRFLVTRDYYDRPACRWFCRWGGAIPVTPGRIEPSALRQALEALARGEVVGIFPEGRLSRNGRLAPPQRGVVELAIRSQAPIVPATIRGAELAFPPTAGFPRPRRVTVAFGPGLTAPQSGASRAEQDAFAHALMRRIGTLKDRHAPAFVDQPSAVDERRPDAAEGGA